MLLRRIEGEIQRRILTPYLVHDDYGWQGLSHAERVNNWNPWCNSNCLATFLLLEKDQTRRLQGVAKILRSLERFLASYGPDGGCDEGPGYWFVAGGSLFDCLELLWGVTAEKIDLFHKPLLREIGSYLPRVHIAGDYFVNFADAKPRLAVDAALLWAYGAKTGDAALRALGASSHGKQRVLTVLAC